jgi:hypothetical protein
MLIAVSGIALSVVCTGCAGKKKVKAALPVPSQGSLTKPAPVLSLPPTIAPIETPVEEAPAKAEEPLPEPDTTAPAVTKKPSPPRRTRPAPPPPAVEVPTPETAAPPAPEPGPQLRELFTPEQRAQYEKELSKNVAEARFALSRASRRKLTLAQRENVSRIQTFLMQAQASRKDDLATALQLARRAALLGQELMKSLLP